MNEDRLQKFKKRREALQKLSDAELKEKFWQLCNQVVDPILDLAATHTSPSIERSVLLRMGIDSQVALGVVDRIHKAGLLGKGAGHVLLVLAKKEQCDIHKAAQSILDNPEVLTGLFSEVRHD